MPFVNRSWYKSVVSPMLRTSFTGRFASFFISSRFNRGIFSRSSFASSLSWNSVSFWKVSFTFSISSGLMAAFTCAIFSRCFCSCSSRSPSFGCKITTLRWVLSSRYFCTRPSKYPVFTFPRSSAKVSLASIWMNGSLSSSSQLSSTCKPYISPLG